MKDGTGFGGDETVSYSDVTSGCYGMNLLIIICGGSRANIKTPLMIFKKMD